MEQSIENKPELKNRILNFYNSNKIKILITIFILLIFLTASIFFKYNNQKKNILIAEKYIEAGLYLTSEKKDIAKKLYEEIVVSNNNFYSILALNTIIEKNLISDKKQIIKYFENLEKSISDKEQKNLIIFKKALYLIKVSDTQKGNILLKDLIDRQTLLKPLAQDLLKE